MFSSANVSDSPKIVGFLRHSPQYSASWKLFALDAFIIAAIILNTIYFSVFWHHIDRTRLRSGIALALASIGVMLASARLSATGKLSFSPLDLQSIQDNNPTLSIYSIDDALRNWRGKLRFWSRLLLGASAGQWVIQAVAAAFWVRFLPDYCRYPNTYRPVKDTKNGKPRAKVRDEESASPVEASSRPPGPLAALFEENERARDKSQTTRSKVSSTTDTTR